MQQLLWFAANRPNQQTSASERQQVCAIRGNHLLGCCAAHLAVWCDVRMRIDSNETASRQRLGAHNGQTVTKATSRVTDSAHSKSWLRRAKCTMNIVHARLWETFGRVANSLPHTGCSLNWLNYICKQGLGFSSKRHAPIQFHWEIYTFYDIVSHNHRCQ